VNTIRNDHINTARSNIKNPEILLILEIQLKNEFIKLSSFLEAAKIIGEVSPRSRDVIVGMGEKLSCIIITAVLKDRVNRDLRTKEKTMILLSIRRRELIVNLLH
jgi:aspartate kinase